MENEIEKIFTEQLSKLPREVIDFLSSTPWEESLNDISATRNITKEKMFVLRRELTLVLAGIMHPDALGGALEEEAGITGTELEGLLLDIEEKILAPIRPALVSFFEKEALEHAEELPEEPVQTEAGEELLAEKIPQKQITDIAPDNLPVAPEEEPLIPTISAGGDTRELGDSSTHPFEEKMKQVFSGGEQSVADLAIESTETGEAKTAPVPPPARPYREDPYREPIE